ncbi:Mediator of RNA polymerase II transcription subunit 12 [Papilio machaon]|uniref:Mediator of RNA polymerase II transcription subunit 12 n=1 Tax=Papilio machaon TaxID=76193 RepID=A0A194R903_PAPMA|nr:Mediator of RNA polymerase II transcription subunit 12 [Papilio machaon]
MGIMYEKRPLKRPRLGPPDVYPQEPRQKEDELTSTNVKHGFATTPQSSDEFGTARNFNYSASKIGQFFSSILSKKEELNTLPDCGRKRQQVNPKDNFWPATARTKAQIEAWFKDLAGSKPLSILAKKAPNFNKKEEIFMTLTEYQVAMPRAAWFIKLSSAYTVAVSEAKIKKRQLPDPTTEWTTTLIKFLKDQIPKLAEHYQSAVPTNPLEKTPPSQSGQGTPSHNSSGNQSGGTTPNSTIPNSMHSPGMGESTDWRQALKLWNYCCRLARYMLDEGLLDRHDFLTWIIELLDKRGPEDGLLRLFLPLALQHMSEFVCCEGLSRRLATTCAKKAAAICSVLSDTTLRALNQPAVFTKTADASDKVNGIPMSPAPENTNGDVKPNINQIKRSATPAESQGTPNPNHSLGTPNPNHSIGTPVPIGTPNPTQSMDVQVKEERGSPPRDVKTTLNTVITAALNPVQMGFSEILNCAYHRDIIIQLATVLQVYEAEQEIAARSKKAESKWCTDKWQTSSQARVLAVLEALDRHCFDRVDPNNNLDTLYKEVFANCTPPSSKDSSTDTKDPEWACSYAVVRVLCEWAVCGARWGEHRAMAAAALLDRRQQLLHLHHDHHATGSDDKESISSGTGLYNGPPIFQNLLLRFLDNDAPVLDESPNAPPGNRQQFANLVHLFGELIRRDVFSHDAYMCTLISRGDLISPTEPTSTGGTSGHTVAPPVNSTGTNHNMDDDIFAGIDLKPKMEENVRMELDDSKIDDDLDKLLQHIKEDQQNSMDAPDSPKDPGEPVHSLNSPMMGPSGMSIANMQSIGMGPMSVPGIRSSSACGGVGGVGGVQSGGASSAPVSRHYHYTMHFPLPPAEPEHTPHDANQRHILLYGVGRQRDDAKHAVKKMTKVVEGGKIKKHSRSEFNFEAVTQKFQAMSMYEQGAVSWAVGGAVCEALAAYAAGATTYLPQPEHVAFALDLMEIALNVHGLIETCIQVLKELSEVEGALITRGAPSSGLAAPRAYTSALALCTVGALRRYHSCLLLCVEQTSAVFEQLCRLVKCVVNPGDCGSAERCVLAQLHDLYKAAAHLCHAPYADTFANAYPKIKQALYSPVQPIPAKYKYDPEFLSEFFMNPRKGKIEIAWARQVAESPANRYNFVCSAMLAVCREVDNDRVNELGVVCAEMTAWCSALAPEWLGALVALCGAQHYPAPKPQAPQCPSPQPNRPCSPPPPPPLYPDLLCHRDLHDAAAHDALAVFTCILVARHCFSLEDFVRHAALPSLVKACGGGGANNPPNAPSPETSARLTCHLLLRLFKTVDTPQPGLYSVSTSPGPGGGAAGVRLSCDRHLLAAAHKNIGVGPVLATLKAILMVSDLSARDGGKPSGKKSSELSHILGTSDTVPTDAQLDLMSMVESEMSGGHRTPRGSGGVGSTLLDSSQSLSSLARRMLAEICCEEWVLQKCLQNPDELYLPDMLLDSMLTPRQAQRLLHMICYPDTASHTHPDLDQKTMITRLLENLEQWSLRMSWLDLQLMFNQFPPGSPELSAWLDTVARAVINVFQQPAPPPPDKDRTGTDRGVVSTSKWSESVWLVAPLVAKLPAAVQGRVLKQAGQILESGWGAGCSGGCAGGGGGGSHRDCKSHQSPSYKGSAGGGGGGKRGVSGMSGSGCACGGAAAVRLANEPLLSLVLTCLRHQDDQKESLLSSIHAQLAHYLSRAREQERAACGDAHDEVPADALLLRFSLAGGMFDAIRRSYQLTSDWAVLLTQLLAHQVIACEPLGCLVDQKGNKISGFDSDKKQGLRLTDKQRVSSWELVEGGRNPAPLSWAWFAATKIERKPLTYENAHRLLKYHTHSLVQPQSYYLESIPLPPEDLETNDIKQDNGSLDSSPTGAGKGRKMPCKNNKAKKPKVATPTNVGSNVGVGGGVGLAAPAQQPQFIQSQQQWFPPPGATYYNPPAAGVSPRSVTQASTTQCKQALSNMLRQRVPFNQMTQMQVIACEPLGCLVDQKGNKISGFDSDKKQGLRLTDKQRVSSWELVEGGRNPAPLSWAWFAATKIERKPLTYENAHRLLKYHTHSLVQPQSYYLESIPLPPEDLETNDIKQDNGSLDSSPTGAGKGRKMPCKNNKAKKPKVATPTNVGGNVGVGGGVGLAAPAQQPQFIQSQQQWFPPPGAAYYNPPAAGVSPRSVTQASTTQCKQALSNMLRQRVPFNQMTQMQQNTGYPGAPHPRAPFPRQGMRQMQPNQMSQMQPNQMNPMSAMGNMGPMGQMAGVQMGPGQMGAGQMGSGQMGQSQMGGGQMGSGQMPGMAGQMFGSQYGGMQQGYGGYGQQMMQGGQQQMMNQAMGQSVNQMSQQVNQMGQGVNSIGQNVGQMSQGVGQGGQMPQGMGQMGQSMGQMSQAISQMGQMGQGGGMGQMNSQASSMGPQGGNAMGGFLGQQSFQHQQNMMSGRASQEAFLAQQRQNARPQYMQAPNVTMGGMSGPAPPYPRNMQPQQSAQYGQQLTPQLRMRQQVLAMQQQQQQGPLVQHLQRQQYQPPY